MIGDPITKGVVKIEVQHQFDLNLDILIETFKDNPERVQLLVPLIEKLSNRLIEKGYEVKIYNNPSTIPESLVIVQYDCNIIDFAKIKEDLISSCSSLGIGGCLNSIFQRT